MTTDCNKIYEHLQTTRKPTGHNLPKAQSQLSLKPQYPKAYALPTEFYRNFIPIADKHNIPKVLIVPHSRCKIKQRNNMRKANTCDPSLKLLNEEITSDIPKHKQIL